MEYKNTFNLIKEKIKNMAHENILTIPNEGTYSAYFQSFEKLSLELQTNIHKCNEESQRFRGNILKIDRLIICAQKEMESLKKQEYRLMWTKR